MKNDLNEFNIEGDKDELYYKIMIIGSKGVGKTQISKRFCKEPFEEKYKPTFGMDFRVHKYFSKNVTATVQIIDVSGQHFPTKDILNEYILDTDCFICVYDITKFTTIKNLNILILEYEKIIQNNNKEQCWLYVGNKLDLKSRECSDNSDDLFEYKPKGYIGFKEVSAKENRDIQDIFDTALTAIKYYKKKNKANNERLKDINSKIKSETKEIIVKSENKSGCSIF